MKEHLDEINKEIKRAIDNDEFVSNALIAHRHTILRIMGKEEPKKDNWQRLKETTIQFV